MTRTVEYCLANVAPATRRRLRDADEVQTVERRCLQHCGRCHCGPFVVVDGQVRAGEDHQRLLADLREGEP